MERLRNTKNAFEIFVRSYAQKLIQRMKLLSLQRNMKAAKIHGSILMNKFSQQPFWGTGF